MDLSLIKTLTCWVNYKLRNLHTKLDDLVVDLSDGVALCLLAGHLTHTKIRGFTGLGLGCGDYVVLQLAKRSTHFHVWWACALGGIIPVTVAVPANFTKQNSRIVKIAGVYKNLASLKKTVVLCEEENLEGLKGCLPTQTLITAVDHLEAQGPGEEADVKPESVVFHQLTSGSTGIPKCIQETHRGVIAQIRGSQIACGYEKGDMSLNWLPFDHVVPMLTTHLRDVYLEMSQVQVPTREVLSDPLLWLDLMDKYEVNFSWSPNFGFKMVVTACEYEKVTADRWNLQHLRFLLNAGEQVTKSVCNAFVTCAGLKPSVMQPSFGMAEACTCMTYCNDYSLNSSFVKGEINADGVVEDSERGVEFIDLGPTMPGVDLRITGSDHVTPVPERTIGHFQIRGTVITPGYLNNPRANAESFVGDGWFDSGDLGFIQDGRLFLTGRAKESIVVRGVNLFCYEVERVVEEVKGVMNTFSAATSIMNDQTGTEDLLIFFCPDTKVVDASVIRAFEENTQYPPQIRDLVEAVGLKVTESLGFRPRSVVAVPQNRFHKTTSGKIQRLKFKKEWLGGLHSPAPTYQLKWTAFEENKADVPGTWILCGEGEVPGLAELIEKAGSKAVVCSVDALDSVKVDRSGGCVVLYTGALTERKTLCGMEAVEALVRPALRVAQWMEHGALSAPLWVLSLRGAPACSALHALARAKEGGRVLRLDRADPAAVFRAVSSSRAPEVALRGGILQSRSVAPVDMLPKRGSYVCEMDGTYVVTGGLGGVGLRLVEWLVDVGARWIVIASRGRGDKARDRLDALRGLGANVAVVSGDIGQYEQAKALFAVEGFPKVVGVFHLAGVHVVESLAESSWDTFRKVGVAKISGTENLHQIANELGTVKQFVLFSSFFTTFPWPSQLAYTVCNAYLDGFAQMRHEAKLPVLVVDWGMWEGAGMGKEGGKQMERLGLSPIQDSEGFRFLGNLMFNHSSLPEPCIFLPADFTTYCRAVASPFRAPLWKSHVEEFAEEEEEEEVSVGDLSQTLDRVAEIVFRSVSKKRPSDYDVGSSIVLLGVDSISSQQITYRLEKAFGVSLSPGYVFRHASVRAIAGDLAKLGGKGSKGSKLDKFPVLKGSFAVPVDQLFKVESKGPTVFASALEQRPLVLIGYGGHCVCVVAILKSIGVSVSGCYVNTAEALERAKERPIPGAEVRGLEADIPRDALVLAAVGAGRHRAAIARRLSLPFFSAVHKSAQVDASSRVGEGTLLSAGVVVEPRCRIGAHVIIGPNAVIGHDAVIGDFAFVAAGAVVAGSCFIGSGGFVGVGASCTPGVKVGRGGEHRRGKLRHDRRGGRRRRHGGPGKVHILTHQPKKKKKGKKK